MLSSESQLDPSIIHIMTHKKNTPARASPPRRRCCYGPLIVGMCLFLSTLALVCNMNLLQNAYMPPLRRYTTLVMDGGNVSNDVSSSPQASNTNHSVPIIVYDGSTTASNTTTLKQKYEQLTANKGPKRRKLDFLIAGFPKCGTTTLVHAFAAHNETDISLREKCQIGGSNLAAGPAYAKLTEVVSELSKDPHVLRGIKCPISLRSHRTLSLLVRHSPETKLIIGIRHPVRFLESHYNYRITELYDKNKRANIPPIESLVNGNEWMGVSTKNARFEISLFQLGKTNMTTAEIQKLGLMGHSAVVPNKFPVFLYSLEQIKDTNVTRVANVRHALQCFLNLSTPLKPLGHENLNRYVGKNAHKETIDICDAKYVGLRKELLSKGRETQLWLRNKFLKSPDVMVANREHFLHLLDEWQMDPCTTPKE